MKKKETYELDSTGRKRLFNYYTCDYCGIEYKKQARQSVGAKYEHFCSTNCGTSLDINNKYTELECAHCNTVFKRLKSKLSTSKHSVYFCSRECKDIGQSYIENIMPDHYGTGSSNYRQKAFATFKHECAACSFNNEYALEVHHIDKNRDNNKINNLIILCANCHTLVHKNKLSLWAISDRK
jgi:hypothetical protein